MEEPCTEEDPKYCDLRNKTDLATFLRYTEGERIIIVIILPIILGIGVCGNLTFVHGVLRIRHMRRAITNYYLLNLAISDLLFLILAVGDKLILYQHSPVLDDQKVLGQWGCNIMYYFTHVFFAASMFLVTAATVEKFYAVCKPLQHRVISGKGRTIKILITVWVVAFLYALVLVPSFANYKSYLVVWPHDNDDFSEFPFEVAKCEQVGSDVYRYISNGIQTLPFSAVMTVCCYMYARIIRALNRRMRTHPASIAANERLHGLINARSQRIRNQVVRMFVINGVVFFCLLSPFQIYLVYLMINGLVNGNDTPDEADLYRSRKLIWGFRMLTYINPVVNPFIYTLSCDRYRRAIMLAIPCVKHLCLRHRIQDRPQGGSSSTVAPKTAHVTAGETTNNGDPPSEITSKLS